MLRRLTLAVIFLVSLGIIVPTVPVLNIALKPIFSVEQAQAQEKKKRKTLFDVLFKRRKKKKVKTKTVKKPSNVRKAKKTTRKKRRTTASRKTKKTPVVIAATKNENASKILVVGDFLAGGMARELEKRYATNANVVIINKSDPASGLVRDDVKNWPELIPALIEEFKPRAVVTLVGMNDRQKLWRFEGQPEKLSPEWLTEYNKRASQIASSGVSYQVPLVWVGLPPVRSGRMNADYLAFNEIYRTKVEAIEGSEYVDIWDGFTNEDGKFVSAGPDINGQIVRLRGSKGINMTRAGRAKLAFFADKALQKIGVTGEEANFEFASFGPINAISTQPDIPEYDPASTGKTVVIPLGTPALDGGNQLEGSEEVADAKKSEDSVSYNLVEKGEVYTPKSGRIDAQWGQPKKQEIAKPEKDKEKQETSSLNKDNRLTAKPAITDIQQNTNVTAVTQ